MDYGITYDTPALQARLDALIAECVALHLPPPPITWITARVEDQNGNIVHEHTEKSNSLVRNYYNLMAVQTLPYYVSATTYGAGYLCVKSTAGATVAVSATKAVSFMGSSSGTGSYLGAAGDNSYGIQVGTGTGAEDFESFVLGTLIANGTSAGQLTYLAGTLGAGSHNAETHAWSQTNTRIMNNNSSGTIVVTEMGLVSSLQWGANTINVLLDRSLFTESISVPAANKLTIVLTTNFPMPA